MKRAQLQSLKWQPPRDICPEDATLFEDRGTSSCESDPDAEGDPDPDFVEDSNASLTPKLPLDLLPGCVVSRPWL